MVPMAEMLSVTNTTDTRMLDITVTDSDPDEAAAIAKDICDASYTYDVDSILVAAVFTTESHFDNSAVSGVGAVGIAQLMPSTAASLKVNPYNRRENIFGGVKYLGQMVEKDWPRLVTIRRLA